jgi:hypothetical protein
MAQYIKQGNIFGRIGSGIGQGLAEQLPKEIQRARMAQGLEELNNQKDLSNQEYFTRALGVPGVAESPQIIQSLENLARQEGVARGFRKIKDQEEANPLRSAVKNQNIPASPQSETGLQPRPSGLVSPKATQAAIDTYIPKNRDQLLSRAADLYDQNRELYPNPEMAMQAAVQEDAQNQAINQAQQGQRNSQIAVEDRAREQLSKLRKAAGVEIPDNVYQQVENDVLDKIKEGEPETEAAKDGQKKLDELSRQYKEFDTISNWTLPFKDPKATRRSIDSLRSDFKKRNDLENFADSLVGRNGLSYSKAYYKAYPVHEYPKVNEVIKSIPKLKGGIDFTKGFAEPIKNEKETLQVAKKLAPLIKSSGASPLSIAEELRMKNYDPDTFLDYLVKNKTQLDLSGRQDRELNKTRNWFPSLNDLWLFIGEGNDKVVEE